MHRVKVNPEIDIHALVASYHNSLSLAFAEICGRSHGGGVLELMPKEVERVVIPYHEENVPLFGWIDQALRKKTPIEEILAHTNRTILQDRFGFSENEVELANRIWRKLSSRRLRRGRKSRKRRVDSR